MVKTNTGYYAGRRASEPNLLATFCTDIAVEVTYEQDVSLCKGNEHSPSFVVIIILINIRWQKSTENAF
jgi:hypothetical protein